MPRSATPIMDAADRDANELVDLVRMAKATSDPCQRGAMETVLMAVLGEMADRELRLILLRLAEREADRRPIRQSTAGVQESLDRRNR